ncbi:MAG: hypothetical protein O6846_01895 [Thaumarchaeota archaeon]|nr:hypothetical protein [Nitrososphaerota archaeon]
MILARSIVSLTDDDIVNSLGVSGSKNDLFVYRCSICCQILIVSGDQISAKQADVVRKENCPVCAISLSESFSCRYVQTSFATRFWVHSQIKLNSESRPQHVVKFASARSLFGLSSRIGLVDSLIGGLGRHNVTFIKGSIGIEVAERYCLRAQLPEELGGLAGNSLFIDGGNSFDAYLFTSIAREYELDFDVALNKLIISRAFTPYQLLELVSNDSDEIFEIYQPCLLVISDIFHLFTQDIEEDEARRIMHEIGCAVRRTSQKKQVPILITSVNRADRLELLFRDYCNVEAEFYREKNQIISKLLKHPSKKACETIQEVSQQHYNQEFLAPLKVISHG